LAAKSKKHEFNKNQSLCTSPDGEKTIVYFEGGQIVETQVFDSDGTLIAHSTSTFDPEHDIQTITNGDKTTTIYDSLGQVTSHQDQLYDWDPWGRLLKVTSPTFTFEASYDPSAADSKPATLPITNHPSPPPPSTTTKKSSNTTSW